MDTSHNEVGAPGGDPGSGGSYEIPFWLKSTDKPKWVSGIDQTTSCSDVLVSLLSAKLGAETTSARIVKDFTLVEQWRGVERALSRSSKILKLWLAWGEERNHVKFVVKRISSSSKTGSSLTLHTDYEKPVKQRHRVRRRNSGSSSIVSARMSDTLHPKKIAKAVKEGGKQQQAVSSSATALSQNIEDMMKIILSQGRLICNELNKLDEAESSNISSSKEATTTPNASSSGHKFQSPAQAMPISRRSSQRSRSVQALNEVVDVSFEVFEEQHSPELVEEMARTRSLTMELARVHAMNEELHNVETKLHILTSNYLQMRKASSSHEEQLSAQAREQLRCTENALSQLRLSNEQAMSDITRNKELLGNMEASFKAKRESVKQLEYDVNVIEKEGRKLTKEFDKVMSIRIPEPRGEDEDGSGLSSGFEDSQVIYSELKELQLQCGALAAESGGPGVAGTGSSRIMTTASPEGSTSGVSSGTEDGSSTAGNSLESKVTTSSSKSSSSSKLCVSDNSRMIVSLKNGGKHLLQEDSNSDTGLSSLHSSSDEGTFEFGTLV